MKAFKGLLIKDFIVSKSWLMTSSIILLFVYFVSFGFSQYYHQPVIFLGFSMVTFGFVGLSIPFYLASTLNMEGQTNLWLHNPNSVWKLLSSKLLIGFLILLCLLTLSLISSNIAIFMSKDVLELSHISPKVWRTGLFFLSAGIILSSVYLGIWFIFYWTIFQMLKKHRILNKFKWIVIIILFTIISNVMEFIRSLDAYERISNIGTFSLKTMDIFDFKIHEMEAQNGSFSMEKLAEINIVEGIIYFIIASIIFSISVRLLERKVEV